MQDLKPQRAVKSDSSWHFVGAQCNGADPLDHGQSSPVLFPRAVGVAALTVSLFGVKALTFSRRKVVQAGNLTSICSLSRCPVPRGSSGRYWLCRTRGRLDIELLGRRTDRALAHLDQRTNGDRAARSRDCFGHCRLWRVLHYDVRSALIRRQSLDRKSTRLNSSHEWISYAVFCLKK